MLVNTAEIRAQIQTEINAHLAKAASLEEKLKLLGQIESLANEVGVKPGDPPQTVAAVPEAKPEVKAEIANAVVVPSEQSAAVEQAAKEATVTGGKNHWANMQQGFQAYLSGKLDKALELFREAREMNPAGFEKTWATMSAIPVYSSVARDKYFMEGLFPPK
jgi:hypothetical protein